MLLLINVQCEVLNFIHRQRDRRIQEPMKFW